MGILTLERQAKQIHAWTIEGMIEPSIDSGQRAPSVMEGRGRVLMACHLLRLFMLICLLAEEVHGSKERKISALKEMAQ